MPSERQRTLTIFCPYCGYETKSWYRESFSPTHCLEISQKNAQYGNFHQCQGCKQSYQVNTFGNTLSIVGELGLFIL